MKILLFLLLLITGAARGQTYLCDSIAYYPNMEDTARSKWAETCVITKGDSTVRFTFDSLVQEFRILSMFTRVSFDDGSRGVGYNVKDIKTGETRKMTFLYNEDIISIGLSRKQEFFVYRVKNRLGDLDP